MTYDEIVMKYIESKIVPGISWVIQQLDQDNDVISNKNREKVILRKFLCDVEEQFSDFLNNPDEDPRDQLTEADIFGDDDIAVGPGKKTAVDFMDPPENGGLADDEDYDDDDDEYGDDYDTGLDYDDGFPKH